MAKIIESHFKPVITLAMYTVTSNGKEVIHTFKEGDIVTDLRYSEDGDIKKVTGRLSKINYICTPTVRTYTQLAKARSFFNNDVIAKSIEIDCSEQYNSKIITLSPRDIIEFEENMQDTKRVYFKLMYSLDVEIELSDNTSNFFTMAEGDYLLGLEYLERGTEVSNDAYYIATQLNSKLEPTEFIFSINNKLKTLPALAIRDVKGGAAPKVEPKSADITEALRTSEYGVVQLKPGKVIGDVVIPKTAKIIGSRANIPANSAEYDSDVPETIFEGRLLLDKGASLDIDGVTLTNTSYLMINEAEYLKIMNCRIGGYEANSTKTMPIVSYGDVPTKLTVKNCYFKKNNNDGVNKCYNMFELYGKLASGSEISNNYFEEGYITHNGINIYNVEEGAVITIKNNIWEMSENAIRIGIKGEPACTIFIESNMYLKTCEQTPEWAGLLLVQPFGKETTSMANCNIVLSGNRHTDDLQLYYLYCGPNDMQFTEENKPKIAVI